MKFPFSKTKIGAILLGASQLVKIRWPEWGAVVEAAGIALGGVGVRDAISSISNLKL